MDNPTNNVTDNNVTDNLIEGGEFLPARERRDPTSYAVASFLAAIEG